MAQLVEQASKTSEAAQERGPEQLEEVQASPPRYSAELALCSSARQSASPCNTAARARTSSIPLLGILKQL